MDPMKLLRRLLPSTLAALLLLPSAHATWSIVVVNTATGEVCVGTATCLQGIDIRDAVPVLKVGVGAGASQSFLSQIAKVQIFDGFCNGDTPADILTLIESTDGFYQGRQFGIVDMVNPSAGHTGSSAGIAKGDIQGTFGSYKYSIQGNVLTGFAVLTAAETALISTPGDMGQKVMAAMEAARALGGDGRCSCSYSAPTSCGAPPPSFTKSAHVGSVQLARIGDVDSACTSGPDCAAGLYYLNLNVIGFFSDPDPVFTLQSMYDTWRANLLGRPDHILSTAAAGAQSLPADGQATTGVTVVLADVDGAPITSGGATLSIASADGGPGLTTVGPVTDHGDGSYTFTLTAGATTGTETLAIVVDDGTVAATLFPHLEVELESAASFHCGFDEISASAGALVPFVVDLGPGASSDTYVVLASSNGTAPGLALPGGALLPLNPDAVTNYTLLHPGPPLLPGSFGALDGQGRATASFEPGPGLLTSAVGLRLDWAAVTLTATPLTTVADGFDILP